MLDERFIRYLIENVYDNLNFIRQVRDKHAAISNAITKIVNKIKETRRTGKDYFKIPVRKSNTRKILPYQFKLELSDATFPIITGIDNDGKLNVSSYSYPVSDKLALYQNFGFKFKKLYNDKYFKNGIDLNNFKLINFPEFNGNIEDLLRENKGGIVPVSSTEGYYIPTEEPLKHIYGIEFELSYNRRKLEELIGNLDIGKMKRIGTSKAGVHQLLKKGKIGVNKVFSRSGCTTVNKHFLLMQLVSMNKVGFNPFELLLFSPKYEEKTETIKEPSRYGLFEITKDGEKFETMLIRPSKFTYAYKDLSVNTTRHTDTPVEIPIGASNLTNMIVFTHHFSKVLEELVNGDVMQKHSSGMHINVMFNKKSKSEAKKLAFAFKYYSGLVGWLGQKLFKDKKRSSNEGYNSADRVRIDDKIDMIRMQSDFSDRKYSAGLIEYRHARMVINSGYIANQLILAGKIHDDILTLGEYFKNNPEVMNEVKIKEIGYKKEERGNIYANIPEEWVKDFFSKVMGLGENGAEWAVNMFKFCQKRIR